MTPLQTRSAAARKGAPNLNRVRELLYYDPSTGLFMWKKARGNKSAGAPAGVIKRGYLWIKH